MLSLTLKYIIFYLNYFFIISILIFNIYFWYLFLLFILILIINFQYYFYIPFSYFLFISLVNDSVEEDSFYFVCIIFAIFGIFF